MNVEQLPEVLVVFIYAMITAVATGLGAIPFFFKKDLSRRLLGWAGAFAAGIMGAASFNLIYEGLEYGMPRTVTGILIGLAFIYISQVRLNSGEEIAVGELSGADAKKALLIVGVMTLHSFAEGVGVGVSFGGGREFGAFISLAIAVHNIPEGLAIALSFDPQGGQTVEGGAMGDLFQPSAAAGGGTGVPLCAGVPTVSPDRAGPCGGRDDLDGNLRADTRRDRRRPKGTGGDDCDRRGGGDDRIPGGRRLISPHRNTR